MTLSRTESNATSAETGFALSLAHASHKKAWLDLGGIPHRVRSAQGRADLRSGHQPKAPLPRRAGTTSRHADPRQRVQDADRRTGPRGTAIPIARRAAARSRGRAPPALERNPRSIRTRGQVRQETLVALPAMRLRLASRAARSLTGRGLPCLFPTATQRGEPPGPPRTLTPGPSRTLTRYKHPDLPARATPHTQPRSES